MKLRTKDTKPTIDEAPAEKLASAIARADPQATKMTALYKNVERLKGQTVIDSRVDSGVLILVTKDLTEFRFSSGFLTLPAAMTVTEAKCPCCFGRGDQR